MRTEPPPQPAGTTAGLPAELAERGFLVIEDVLSPPKCAELIAHLPEEVQNAAGSRGLLDWAECAKLNLQLREHPALRSLIPAGYVATQCTYFEKSTATNWLVPFHQDLSIQVAEQVAHPDLRGWSMKEGEIHVLPPDKILRELLAVRLHLDPCGSSDGALRVIPGSHLKGVLTSNAVTQSRQNDEECLCPVGQGGVLIMRPLLLHASSKAVGSSRRRVLHFVYAPPNLPYGLRWKRRV